MKIQQRLYIVLTFLLLFNNSVDLQSQRRALKIAHKITNKGQVYCVQCTNSDSLKIDTVIVNLNNKSFVIQLDKTAAYSSMHEQTVQEVEQNIQKMMPKRFRKWPLQVVIDSLPLDSYVSNYYRTSLSRDEPRIYYSSKQRSTPPLLLTADEPIPTAGLYNHNIALWHSHGLYYDVKTGTWSWQRPSIYGTIEDLFPLTFVLPYLAPMLENAGAVTLIPRERDCNTNEVIVDNDQSTKGSEILTKGTSWHVLPKGYQTIDPLRDGDNPFQRGTYLSLQASNNTTSELTYLPNIPATGDYAVYLSWHQDTSNVSNAQYIINYSGGSKTIEVNEKMGGGTWIYAGKYHFEQGKNKEIGSVIITNKSKDHGTITTDAVRFGGGMGTVARCNEDSVWTVSGQPRYVEGSRCYLQYSGIPDTLVYSLHGNKNDYTDDYQSRGIWVNYLKDSLNIPIDLSFAFHTDAGMMLDNKIVGTLLIYSTVGDSAKVYKNGVSKMANRDLADLVQTQIVHDIRTLYDSTWTNRGMWDKQYSEAKRADVPTFLLELLSHQNLADALWGQDPKFKFTVSRAIYKGILRFVCDQENRTYVVQPLPVRDMRIEQQNVQTGKKQLKITWQATVDSLEPTAVPTAYRLYTRKNDEGFDGGRIIKGTQAIVSIDDEQSIYSYRVCAYNDGGLSFPSEILSAYLGGSNPKPVTIVNAFTRVSAPDYFSTDAYAGIPNWKDQGVPDGENMGYAGEQYDFNKKDIWKSDANPGWGASYTDQVGKVVSGNTFDFPYKHGSVLKDLNYSFISMSLESFCENTPSSDQTLAIDIILGKQRTCYAFNDSLRSKPQFNIYTPAFNQALHTYLAQQGKLLMSGAYLSSELQSNDTLANSIKSMLHFAHSSDRASKTGEVQSVPNIFGFNVQVFNFNTNYNRHCYAVESPDALTPEGKGAGTILRYKENNKSAGIAYKGNCKVVALGFPFETVLDKKQAQTLMRQIMQFLTSK